MLVLAARLMWSFGMPEILLSVRTEDPPVAGDEVRSVKELEVSMRVFEYIAAG